MNLFIANWSQNEEKKDKCSSHLVISNMFPQPLQTGAWFMTITCAVTCEPCAKDLVETANLTLLQLSWGDKIAGTEENNTALTTSNHHNQFEVVHSCVQCFMPYLQLSVAATAAAVCCAQRPLHKPCGGKVFGLDWILVYTCRVCCLECSKNVPPRGKSLRAQLLEYGTLWEDIGWVLTFFLHMYQLQMKRRTQLKRR